MKRKVLPVLLAAALALFPAAVSAAEPEVVGRWGIGNDKETAYADGSVDDSTDLWDVTATLYADGTLVLDGQGDTQNYSTVPTKYPEWYNDREQITKVEVRGNIKPDNADLLFFRLVNCTEIVGLENLDTSQATSIRSLFMECESLKTVDVSGLRTGNAKNMSSMFRDCFALERVDLSGLDTENCTNLANMFVNCRSLQEVLGLHIKGENVNAVKMFSNWYLSDIGPEALHKIEIRVDHEIKRPGLSLYQEVKKYAPDGSAYRFLGWYREQSPDFSGELPQAYEKVSAEEGVWQMCIRDRDRTGQHPVRQALRHLQHRAVRQPAGTGDRLSHHQPAASGGTDAAALRRVCQRDHGGRRCLPVHYQHRRQAHGGQ